MSNIDKIKSIKKSKPAIYKAIELKVNNPSMPLTDIAKAVGRDPSNIYRALKNYGIDTKKVNTYKKLKADILAGTQGRIIEAITDEDLTKAGLRDKAIAFGVLYDKERLERGQSTQNISLANVVERMDKKFRTQEGSNEYVPNAYNKEKGIDSNKWNKEQAAIKGELNETIKLEPDIFGSLEAQGEL
jgi:ATP-dependent protease HslVU (ClpYQ) ATPase subunit